MQFQSINHSKANSKPLFLKIAPDLTDGQIQDISEIVSTSGIDGVVATNTTISRAGLATDSNRVSTIGNGGLSGQPVKDHSTSVVRRLRELLGDEKVIIGVGGIASKHDAKEKLEAGADLVQIYSGLIYEGPWLVKEIAEMN